MIEKGHYISVVGKEATHYHSVDIDPPYWSEDMEETARVGNHVFYRKVIDEPLPRPENFAQLICENMDQCMKVEEE
jgi:hypothetical protein